jgi:hypothetical protein
MANAKSPRFAGTSAIRQIRFTLGFWENDNHRAQWRVPCGYNLWEGRAVVTALAPVIPRHRVPPSASPMPGSGRESSTPRPIEKTAAVSAYGIAGSSRAMTPEGAFNSPAAALACPKAVRSTQRDAVAVRSAMSEKGMPAIPRPQGTRASANTSGPDFTLTRRPLVKLRSPLRRAAPNEENLFLLPDRALASEPAKRTIRPLT